MASTLTGASEKDDGHYVSNPGPQALSDFVMDTDHAGSSQGMSCMYVFLFQKIMVLLIFTP